MTQRRPELHERKAFRDEKRLSLEVKERHAWTNLQTRFVTLPDVLV